MSWRRASCIIGMFRFKFNEIDGIKKACLKTYMRQKWSRQVLLHHLFTSTSSQHLGSSRFFYGIHVAHLCGLQFCVFFYFPVLVLCIYLEIFLLHCPIALLLACILMIGLYIYTNHIQWYSDISQAC